MVSTEDDMRSGAEYLEAAAVEAARLHRLDAQRAEIRESLLANLVEAAERGQTQQDLGDACDYSRARIGQFLKEARKTLGIK